MKTTENNLISASQDAIRAGEGFSIIWLAHLTIGDTIHYYSTRGLTIGEQAYSAIMISSGRMSRVAPEGFQGLGAIDDTHIVFSNHRSGDDEALGTIETLQRTYELEGREVKIGCVFEATGLTASDIIWIARYRVDEVTSDSDVTVLRCVDPTLGLGEQPVGRIIDNATFPLAQYSSYGQMLPIIFGACQKCPLIPVAVGKTATLDGSLDVDATSIAIVTAWEIPAAGTGRIDNEIVRWTAIDGTASVLRGVTRGQDGTSAAIHVDGSQLLLSESSYVFAVADHPCLAVSDVRVEGELKELGTDYAVDTNYRGPANTLDRPITVVSFSEPPSYSRIEQFAITADLRASSDEDEFPEWSWAEGDANAKTTWANVVDHEDPRAGVALDSPDVLQVKLETDLTVGALGRLVNARAKIEYFTLERDSPHDPPARAHVNVIAGGNTIKSIDLKPAPAEEHEIPGAAEHTHKAGTIDAAHDTNAVTISMESTRQEYPDYCEASTGAIRNPGNLNGSNWEAVVDFPTGLALDEDSYLEAHFEVWGGISTSDVLDTLRVRIHAASDYAEYDPGVIFIPDWAYKSRLRCKLYVGSTLIMTGPLTTIAGDAFSPYGNHTLLEIPGCAAKGVTWQMLSDDGVTVRIEKAEWWTRPGSWGDSFKGITTTLRARTLWIESVRAPAISATFVAKHEFGGETSASDALDTLARSSSLAIQTVSFTQALRDAFAGDLWAAFDGGLTIEINPHACNVANLAYVTQVWIELEYRPRQTLTTFAGLTAYVQGLAQGSYLLRGPTEIAQKVFVCRGAGLPAFGFMGLSEGAVIDVWSRAPLTPEGTWGDSHLRLWNYTQSTRPIGVGLYFNRRIDSPMSAKQALEEICLQSRSAVFWEGEKVRFVVRDHVPGDVVFTFDASNVVDVEGKAMTPTDDVFNELRVSFNENYDYQGEGTDYDAAYTAQNAVSIARPWGRRPKNYTARWLHMLPVAIGGVGLAKHLAEWWVEECGNKRMVVTLRTSLTAIHVERLDPVLVYLPRHGLNRVVGWVVGIVHPSLAEMQIKVALRGWAAQDWVDDTDSETRLDITPGNQDMILRLAGAPVWSLSATGVMRCRSIEEDDDSGWIVAHNADGDEPLYYDSDESRILFRYRLSGAWSNFAYVGTDAVFHVAWPIEESVDLSGETPTDIYSDQTATCLQAGAEPPPPPAGGADAWFVLGGTVVGMFDFWDQSMKLAGRIEEGTF